MCLLRLGAAELGFETPEAKHGGRPAEVGEHPPKGGYPGSGAHAVGVTKTGDPGSASGRRLGDYELLEPIGQGGMGVVYKARQISLDRVVALKLLPFGPFSRDDVVQRFRAEAGAAAALQHPNIVAIHEVGEHAGQPYFSMDYVEGRTLAEVVREKPLPAKRAAIYLKTIAVAVHYAHQHGILHRDLKPANILIDAFDQPRITDFGLAKRLLVDSDLTLTGQVLGSPNFMSPEQAEGRQKEVGPTSDVYALGGLLYHLLTRQPPFQSETLTTLLKQVLESEPVAPRLLNPSVPRDLETICLKCLEKEIARRYPTAQALADDLGRFLEGEPIRARPVGPLGRGWKWCRRRPALAGALASLSATFLLGLAGVIWQWQQTRLANVAGERREYANQIALAQSVIGSRQFERATDILNGRTPERYRGWEWGWLLRQCHQDLMTLTNAGGLFAVFSPDSRFLAIQGPSTNILLWDLRTDKPVQSFVGHTFRYGVSYAAFTPDGRQLASAGWGDGTVRIWDVATGRELRLLPHSNWVYSLSYHPEGKKLATGCFDGKARIWDIERGVILAESPPNGDEVYCAEFSPDGQRVAYAGGYYRGIATSRDASVRVWDPASGEVRRLDGHTQSVSRIAWSPRGDLLASVGWDGRVKLWDPAATNALATLSTGDGRGVLMGVAFSPDGRRLVVAGTEYQTMSGRLEVFDVASRRRLHELVGHATGIGGVSFAPNGRLIASAGDTFKVWAAEPPPTYLSLEGHDQTVWTVAFSTDGNYVATGGLDQTVKLWNATNGELVKTIAVNFPAVSLAFSPEGNQLVTVGPEHTACIWPVPADPKARTSRRAEALPEPSTIHHPPSAGVQSLPTSAATANEPLRLRGHSGTVLAVAWSPDHRWIATGGKDRQVILWDAPTGRERCRLRGHTDGVLSLAFAPDSKLLATGGEDATVRLWDLAAARCRRVLTNHHRAVLSLAFSPVGHLLASGEENGLARLWDTETWRELHAFPVSVNGPTALAFSPDGRRLATAGGGRDFSINWARDNRVRLWDVERGQEIFTLLAHSNAVYGVAFSPDGRQLATASGDNTARLWTAFPWRTTDYPGEPRDPLATRVEEYKRRLWHPAPQPPADPARRLVTHAHGDFNVPALGSKTQPLFPTPPRDDRATPDQLDLGAVCNVALNESWQPLEHVRDVDRSFAALEPGLQSLAGVQFDVRGLVQLRRLAADCGQFPERAVIPAGRRFRRLHALHGTRWGVREAMPIAAFVLHYAGGARAELPVVYGEHVRQEDAGSDPRSEAAHAVVAWTGPSAETPGGWQPRLYRATFDNPHPEWEVRQIEYLSTLTQAAPFLVALTVE